MSVTTAPATIDHFTGTEYRAYTVLARAELPSWSVVIHVTLGNVLGYRWRNASVIGGPQVYMLDNAGAGKILKAGRFGRLVCPETVRYDYERAEREWVAAGRPATFTYRA